MVERAIPQLATANTGDHMHDALAFRFFAQRPLDCFDLAANAADAGEQLFLSQIVCAMRPGGLDLPQHPTATLEGCCHWLVARKMVRAASQTPAILPMNFFSKPPGESHRIGAETTAHDGLLAAVSRLQPSEACAKLGSALEGLSETEAAARLKKF